jgi:hypothetical protein
MKDKSERLEEEVISILSTALLHLMDIGSKGRIHECETVGFVHSTVSKEDKSVKTWIIKFDPESCAFGIEPVKTDKFPEGAVLYWHDNNGDAATQAALFGDGVIDES